MNDTDVVNEPTTEIPANAQAPRRTSPALVIFLIFPLIGLVAAAVVILSNPGGAGASATPMPVALPPPKIQADTPIIDFTLTALDGSIVSLSDYSGRIVFLNFWATWCEPCKRELPAFQAFQEQQSADGPVILAVDVAETPDQVRAFLDEYGVSGLIVPLDSDKSAANSYGVFNMPTTFVIDGNGIVNYIKYGEATVADLNSYLDALHTAAASS